MKLSGWLSAASGWTLLLIGVSASGVAFASAADVVAIKQIRSLLAEAAFSAELYKAGKITKQFNASLMNQASEELKNAEGALRDDKRPLIERAEVAIRSADSVEIRAIADDLLSLLRDE